MTTHTIVCANCGARYKLPETFAKPQAKCKACGGVIDVAAQREAIAKQAAGAAEEVAKPARPRRAAAEVEPPRRRPAPGSRRRRGRADEAEEEGGRRHRPAKKGGVNVVTVGSAVGLLVVAVVAVVFALSGGNDGAEPAAPDETGKAPTAQAEQPLADAAPAAGAVDAAAAEAQAKEAAAARDEAADAEAANQAQKAKADAEKEQAEKKEKAPLTRETVFDPKSLDPLEYPAYLDEAGRKEIDELCATLRRGGIAGRRAKQRLEEIGHPAIVGVINEYRKIDFTDSNQALYAFELNKFLTNAFGAGVVNAPFRPHLPGEEIPLADADWNGKTVKAWQRFWFNYSEKEAWERLIENRKRVKDDDR